MQIENNGKLIVIDGTDGSGKATQTALLANRLKHAGFEVEIADFPQYGHKSAGLVEEYLNGKYGRGEKVSPYISSIFYAADRYDASFEIKKWLNQGKIVISNRYVTANMGHQGSKIENPLERKHFFEWLNKLEYELFSIPKPDLNIILNVEPEIAQGLIDQKGFREYLNGGKKRDIHEADIEHLENASKVYLEMAASFSDFELIECTRNKEIISKEEINWLIWEKVSNLLDYGQHFAPNFKALHEKISPISSEIKLRVERLTPSSRLPSRNNNDDAGLDFYANDYYSILPGQKALIKTGIKIAIPQGHVGLIWDKSSIAKNGIHVTASVIDTGFRGEVLISVINLSGDIYNIAPGQQVAQILIQKIELPVVIEDNIIDIAERGKASFGNHFV